MRSVHTRSKQTVAATGSTYRLGDQGNAVCELIEPNVEVHEIIFGACRGRVV